MSRDTGVLHTLKRIASARREELCGEVRPLPPPKLAPQAAAYPLETVSPPKAERVSSEALPELTPLAQAIAAASEPSAQAHQSSALLAVRVPPEGGLGKERERTIARAEVVLGRISGFGSLAMLGAPEADVLRRFGGFFGASSAKFEIPGAGRVDALDVAELNRLTPAVRTGVLSELKRALATRISATQVQPEQRRHSLELNDPAIGPLLAPHYDGTRLTEVIAKLGDLGVFALDTDPVRGLVRTADAPETWQMNDRQWITDTVMVGALQKGQDPGNYRRALLASAAASQSPAFLEPLERSIADPEWFRQGGPKSGVPHIYLPATLRLDPSTGAFSAAEVELDPSWGNQKRLESQALLLGALAEALASGFRENAAWGLGPELLGSPEAFRQVRDTVVGLARYLIAVNRAPGSTDRFDFAAPSASSWEEQPLAGGMTWDSAAAVLAFERLRDLVFGPDPTGALGPLREALRQAPGGELFSTTELLDGSEPVVGRVAGASALLDAFIDQGREMVAQRVVRPLSSGALPSQHPARPADTSLLLLCASDYRFVPGDLAEDARVRLGVLRTMKRELLREHGVIRYGEYSQDGVKLHDSYLNLDYWQPPALRAALHGVKAADRDFGAKEASTVEDLLERQAMSKESTTAQWCLGLSAMLQGFARAKVDLMESGRASPKLLAQIDVEIDALVSRNLAAICGGDSRLKSTGHPVPSHRVMEAYEAVTDLMGEVRFVPGAHPLAWGTAQLHSALEWARRAAQ